MRNFIRNYSLMGVLLEYSCLSMSLINIFLFFSLFSLLVEPLEEIFSNFSFSKV